MVSRRSYSLIEIFSAWLFLLWLNSLITSDTAARRFQVSSPAASFTRKTHRSSPVTMEMVRSVNAAPPITTAGSAQSECKLTGSTRLSTATNHPLPWFSISHPVRVKPERDDLPPQHFASYSNERPEAELHCLTTAPSPTSLCSSAAVSELDLNRSLDVSFHCVVMDLRPSSGLDESYGSRYGNIGVLFLSWISVYAPLWIIVKRIVSPLRRLYYTPDIAAAPSHQGFYGAKLHWLNLCLQVKSVVSPELLMTMSPLRLYHTMPSQASTVLHKAGVAFPISSSLELLCKSVDSPELLITSLLRVHHITPSQTSTVLHRVYYTSYPLFAHTCWG
ncbi:unnamed protein product [Brassica oleracea var. botrytis]